MSVLIQTSLGDIVIDVHCKDTPKTALNFLKLCKGKVGCLPFVGPGLTFGG